ncbi:hypothetical protein [Kribbella ginsengisoli]|uniref:Uncharacterized protein n=1 Tax=Kribbella ginsengisoli TaxID=363865 RepID=A0ABP6W1P3_9ACTN
MNDDELLARLRSADPAKHAPEPNLDRLLETTMSTDTETRPTRGTYRRRWLPAVAAGVLLAAGGIGWAVAGNSGNSDAPPAAVAPVKAPVKLTIGAAPNAKCRAVEVADLQGMQTAFQGTATAIKGEQVTLHVDHWYKGGDATTVEVQSDADAVLTLLGVDFKVGGTYLVTATDGHVSLCGESGESNPELLSLYKQAFGG